MIKKISVFIAILGLVFVAIPRPNVNAQSYEDGLSEGYNEGYGDGYRDGLNEGFSDGYFDGYNDGLNEGANHGYQLGKADGYDEGYAQGISDNIETGGFGLLLASAFTAVGALLSIELLPNISIGAIVAIPIVFGVVMFIIGRRKE